nr:contractile injection system tape measure protein [uncultured Psychroserpens sp.]
MNTETKTTLAKGISINNAGLVMFNAYFLMLLERLGAITNNTFNSEDDQLNAVHYFQYIVTGLTETEEIHLTLNKILCGLPIKTPVRHDIEITESEKQLIQGLIKAFIGSWSAIGDSSIEGFRGNWLVRNAILNETEERWELIVEKKAYDILLLKSPFSFSIIKLPWMTKPLHVNWPF